MAFTENFRQIEFNPDKEIYETFRATQGDTKSQGFNVVVFLGGKKKVITTETMSFFAQKPDGTRVIDTAVKDGDGFKIELKNQVFAVPGVVVCTLVLNGASGEKLADRKFKILVAGSMEDGAIISEDERGILDRAFDLATDIVPRLEGLDVPLLENVDSEITLARGTEPTLGARLDADIARLDADIAKPITPERTTYFEVGKNMLNHAKGTEGYYVSNLNGQIMANVDHAISDYIDIAELSSIVVSGENFGFGGLRHAFYNTDKVFVSGDNSYTQTVLLTVPVDAKYIRISTKPIANFYKVQVESGTTATPFEPFEIKIPESYLKLEEREEYTPPFEPKSLLLKEEFKGNTLPSNFSNNGFTINDGAISPAVGGIDKQINWLKESTTDKGNVRVWFTPNDTTTDIAILRKSWYASGLAGVYRFDGINNKLIMYTPWQQNLATLSAIAVEKEITLPIIAGRKYLLEVIRNTVRYHTFRITDTITGQFEEVVNDFVSSRAFSMGHGYTGVIAFGGDFKINKMEVASAEPLKARVAIYGDSFIEASTLILDGGLEARYAHLLKNKLNGDMYINGRGGEASAQLISKMDTDFKTVKADYVVLAIGTNDTNYLTWLANIQTLIALVEEQGSIPILMTLTKITSSDRTAFMTAVNNWILSSGYRYVDANLVTTLNNDRQTQDTTLFKADGVHPNALGHEVIYKRFLVDVPEIFDGY